VLVRFRMQPCSFTSAKEAMHVIGDIMMNAFLRAHAVAVERARKLSEQNARSDLRPSHHPSGCLSNCPLKQLSPHCRSQRHSCVAWVVRDLERHNRLVESLPNRQWIIRPERRRQSLQCRPVAK
jgi:hypothetical protein